MAFVPPASMVAHSDGIGIAIPGFVCATRGRERGRDWRRSAGRLIYRGHNVMMGSAKTAADLARGSDLDELATGDLVVRNAARLYRIVGRKSRFANFLHLSDARRDGERAADLGMLAVALLLSALLGIATWWESQRLAASGAS